MDPGTYTILLALDRPTTVTFGAAGDRDLAAGYYAYTGSAFGPGGLSRVDRHRRIYEGDNDTRHWHIDYLLGAEAVRWDGVWKTVGADRECAIAGSLAGTPVSGVGATDCGCPSHLRYNERRDPLVRSIEAAHS